MKHQELNNRRLAYYAARKGGWLQRVVRSLTRWAWREQVEWPVTYLHERGLIDSYRFHEGIAFSVRVANAEKPPAQSPNDGDQR
jgi:hypothetical protein